ncbi:energy-coupling factor transporter ATP-binding protein EcfA2 [Rhizobium sp. SG_E_25_P2]|uniref:NACHT domain-containing protein n=1 Tax=Rhizobium sp. SG_E_25_P2 TaxID=2879942 RepID=UPI00247640F7|nr:NACHT domain-containing protein [Rhizobium sp. SG_E_25_P2]MDH6268210.1 energy-coupling factor transporter ATP-binding protein EcfA2 [Rhizobium sp. SG_E_25_P2]
MTLPFGELSWENFERLCYRLAIRDGSFDHVARYGRQGQQQEGIDIFARLPDLRYVVWQAKRYKAFGPTQLAKAVNVFLEGDWVERTDSLVIAVQANLDDTAVQDEIETQTGALRARGISLSVLGGDSLVDKIRSHQDLVLSFFGRNWFSAFYGELADTRLMTSLDGEEFARVRDQLYRLYTARFSDLDPGMVAADFSGQQYDHRSVPLLERFTMTDVYMRERVAGPMIDNYSPSSQSSNEKRSGEKAPAVREEVRRMAVADWFADGEHMAVVADAGAGKSTLLRALALDLLGSQTIFAKAAARWGERLPVLVSFSKWARLTSVKGDEIGLRDVIASSLQPLLTANLVDLINRAIEENRVLLIVDGLDEWADEQAARTALQSFLAFVQVHQVPTVASGRPLGLRKIGSLPQTWKTGQLAPLSAIQQRQLALSWFSHVTEELELEDKGNPSLLQWQADRFLNELRSEPALGELAQTPLLFVGLLFLALRRVALPRNRSAALRSLIELLLEIHPAARATAAGDVRPRFQASPSLRLRQGALAALAFASRKDGGDAGYPRGEARSTVQNYLVDQAGLDPTKAEAATDELLAVNAETVGLIVEKGPGEIGFAHASLEEFLSALHVQSWPLSNLLDFVRSETGNPRWKNVLRNLVAVNDRANEIDEIVEAIESVDLDPIGSANRRQLLAEIAFSPSPMRPQTAVRLAKAVFRTIEGGGTGSEKSELARIAVNGLSDPTLSPLVERRIARWAPRRVSYTADTYQALATWDADDETFDALADGLGDEDRSGARAAAMAIARRFGGDAARRQQLEKLTGSTSNIEVAASAIMALVMGWQEMDFSTLIEKSMDSGSPLLEAVAIWSRVRRKRHTESDRARCLKLVAFSSMLDFRDQEIAREALFEGWKDDDLVVDLALASLDGRPKDMLDKTFSAFYLTRTAPGRPNIKSWILDQLQNDHPFVLLRGQEWDGMVPFCEADSEIREATIRVVLGGDLLHRGKDFWPIVANVKDERLRDHAIEMVRGSDTFAPYWNLLPLLRGWATDPAVLSLKKEVLDWTDERLGMIVALLPELYDNAKDARTRLLRIAKECSTSRIDLIVHALADLGCDGSDDEATRIIMNAAGEVPLPAREPVLLYLVFKDHPLVEAAAKRRLNFPDPPLSLLARAFPRDPAIRERILCIAHCAPVDVRAVIGSAATLGADRHPSLHEVLKTYRDEVDFPLKVQLSIDYHTLGRAEGLSGQLIPRLVTELERPDIMFEDQQAAAFAGLLIQGAPEKLLDVKLGRQRILLSSLVGGGTSAALCSLVISRWEELRSSLGPSFVDRLSSASGDEVAWHALAPYVASNPSASQDFLEWCRTAKSLGPSSLKALAELYPGNDILYRHVWNVLENSGHYRDYAPVNVVAAAEILRDQFRTDDSIEKIRRLFREDNDVVRALPLAIVAPGDPMLRDRQIAIIDIGKEYHDWLSAVVLSAHLDDAAEFCRIVYAMSERNVYPGRQGQEGMTKAIVERLARDEQAASILNQSLQSPLSAKAFAATAMALVAAGLLDPAGHMICYGKMVEEHRRDGPPLAVLDIMRDETKSFAHLLMDIVQTRAL